MLLLSRKDRGALKSGQTIARCLSTTAINARARFWESHVVRIAAALRSNDDAQPTRRDERQLNAVAAK